MKGSAVAAWLLGATLVIAGCSGAPDDDARGPVPAGGDTTGTLATGTAGDRTDEQDRAPAQRDLPDTASPLALIAGMGLVSLAAAGALRAVLRHGG